MMDVPCCCPPPPPPPPFPWPQRFVALQITPYAVPDSPLLWNKGLIPYVIVPSSLLVVFLFPQMQVIVGINISPRI